MLVKLIIRLSALSLGLSYVATTTPQQKSQLATLHERMNQMISALYSSPLLSKAQAASSSEELPSTSHDPIYNYPAPPPQVVYVAPPAFLESGAQPIDYGYPGPTSPVPRSAWPYPYEISYQPQIQPPAPVFSSYRPEYARSMYPQVALPAPLPPLPPAPLSYPSYAPSVSYPCSPFPGPHQSFPVAPPPASYPQIPYPPPQYPTSYASSYPSLPYAPLAPPPHTISVPASYQSPLQQYPSPYGPLSGPYLHQSPVPYPPQIPYSQPMYPQSIYSQPIYPSPSPYPKPFDILPQPQYEFGS